MNCIERLFSRHASVVALLGALVATGSVAGVVDYLCAPHPAAHARLDAGTPWIVVRPQRAE
jgi:hypothetical protein